MTEVRVRTPRRTEKIEIRVTPEEKQLIQEMAGGDVSAFIRRTVLDASEPDPIFELVAAERRRELGAAPGETVIVHACPAAGCGYAAPSPRAVCPTHGRRVA